MDLKRRRKSEKGTFPPNPNQWDAERIGINLRLEFEIPPDGPLRPFGISIPNTTLLKSRLDVEEFIDESLSEILFEEIGNQWSGMTIPCDDEFIVIVNETHSANRNAATLMEEYFHILLDHSPCRIFQCPSTGMFKRQYEKSVEEEAYFSAAASLVPYRQLKTMVAKEETVVEIASHFEVSRQLVTMRLKTCRLYRKAIKH